MAQPNMTMVDANAVPVSSTAAGVPATGGRISTDTARHSRRRRLSMSMPFHGRKHHDVFGQDTNPHRRKHFGKPSFSGFQPHFMAGLGEFIGTTMFLFLAEGGAKTAQLSVSAAQTDTATPLSNETIMFIALSFGMSLLVSAWMFYRITGGLFNPAITIALWLVGVLTTRRAVVLFFSQILGGIAAAGLVLGLTPTNSVSSVTTTLQPGINITQGFLIEMLLTSILVFSVLMLAVEKHRATYLAPVGIGLTLMAAHLFGAVWTGCGMNPARSFGPAVVARQFNSDHWIYWIAPICGGILSVVYFSFLKLLKYNSVVLDQDSDTEVTGLKPIHTRVWNLVRHGENPSALNPESSTHYDSKARAEFDQEQREVFEEREQIRAGMMDKPVFDGHANTAAEGRMAQSVPGHGSPVSTGSTLAHTTSNNTGKGPILPK
ncbi:Major intrinsic protein [Kalmanozyma brasiliensis GHG001]|uniref:Aquaporin n=1 Tax=Kalmanozyma brasiliensis (strain GHG001) TaxID=1365824 RepID=V5F2Z3_KALBG|nr:Major intrinsic protein [Kalmanozyma brasiliensis GHG001]EST09849.1 Major intrinsic protein [Kalmanozyma brasiliensis GHG001]